MDGEDRLRVVVDEGGKRRAFKVGDGVLTVGSGPEARLRLADPGVAEVHAELEVEGGAVRLRPRPGVVAPLVGGRPAGGEVAVPLRTAVQIGGARLWLEPAEGPVRPPDEAPPPTPARVVLPGADPVEREARREAAIAQARKRRRPAVQRNRPRVKRGLPGWAIALLLLGGAGGVVFLIGRGFTSSGETMGAQAIGGTLAAARELVEAGVFDDAERRLGTLPEEGLTDAQVQAVASMRAEMAERRQQQDVDVQNLIGTDYMNVYLKRYEKNHLQLDPELPKVRLFLKRCEEFQRRWPRHPELDWVRRQRSRFEGMVDLSQPNTFEDVAWEVNSLVDTSPRDYKSSFALIDDYLTTAGGPQARKAEELRAELVEARAEYHVDRLHQAEYEYDRNDSPAKAVWWLVHSILWLGDEEMEDEAAVFLLRFPRLDEHLRGYREKYPEKFEGLLENERVRAYARKHGLLEGS